MKDSIVAAFVPLVDCAALVAKKEEGFVRAYLDRFEIRTPDRGPVLLSE